MMLSGKLEAFTHRFAKWAGSTHGFLAATLSIFGWTLVGNCFDFSNDWQNAFTIYISVITFLMIFLIQRAQNKELSAVHVKLNELIMATRKADNRLINVEDLSEKEISEVHEGHRKVVVEISEVET